MRTRKLAFDHPSMATDTQYTVPSIKTVASLPAVYRARRELAKHVIERVSAKFNLESEFDDTIIINVTHDVAQYLRIAQDPGAILAPTHLRNTIKHYCDRALDPKIVKFDDYVHEHRTVIFRMVT